jgi:putative flippase GtrA
MKRLLRSMLASGAATIVDLSLLMVLTHFVGARVASIPALLCAAIVNFIGNRRAFESRGDVRGQAIAFASVQAMSIALNAVLFDLAVRYFTQVWLVRIAVSNAVYLAWSFPMFGRVFPRMIRT